MNTLTELLTSAVAQRIGWALVHFLWQGTAVALLLAAGLALLRRRSAQSRWVACCAALALMAALPVATALLVSVKAPPPQAATADVGAREGAVSVVRAARPRPKQPTAQRPADAWPAPQYAQPSPAAAEMPAPAPAPVKPPAGVSLLARFEQALRPALPWAILTWLAGVLAMSVWHLGGWCQVRRLKRCGTRPAEAAIQEAFLRVLQRLKIRRPARVMESLRVAVPVVAGWLRPLVLLPVGLLAGLTPAQLEAILAHELAHVRRWDVLVQAIQAVIETLLFYHPAVWWVSRRIRQESEQCCDDLAVSACGDRRGYAHALAIVAGASGRSASLTPAASGGKLLPRLRRIMGLSEPATSGTARSAVAILVVLATLAVFIGLHASARGGDAAQTATQPATRAADRSASQPTTRAHDPAAAMDSLKGLVASLRRDLAKAIAERYGLTVTDATWPKDSTPFVDRAQYFHNCRYWGKRGWEDTGGDAIGIMFDLAKPEVLDKAEAQTPHHRWQNLGLIGWDYRHYGKDVPADLKRRLDALLDSCVAAIGELDKKAETPATRPALSQAQQKEKIKADYPPFEAALKDLLKQWRQSQPASADALAGYDMTLQLDLQRGIVGLYQAERAASEYQLPDGYEWSLHRVTPDGTANLGKVATLQLRHWREQQNVCQEVFLLRGKLNLGEAGMFLDVHPSGGNGMGNGLVKIPAEGYVFRPVAPRPGTVDQSLLVSGPTDKGATSKPSTQPATSGQDEDLHSKLVTYVYDARDLVGQLASGEANTTTRPAKWASYAQLAAFIKQNVTPKSWEPGGGGTIREMNGQLVVVQTQSNHAAIAAFFWEQGERLAGRQVRAGDLIARKFRLRSSEAERIGRRLMSRLSAAQGPPLVMIGDESSGRGELTVYATAENMKRVEAWVAELDVPAGELATGPPSPPAPSTSSGPSTQPAEAASGPTEEMLTRVYDVRDLTKPIRDFIAPSPWSVAGEEPISIQPSSAPDDEAAKKRIIDALIGTIKGVVAPDSWEPKGNGAIRILDGLFVVTQTSHNQKLLLDVLAQLRQARSLQVAVDYRFIQLPAKQDAQLRQWMVTELKLPVLRDDTAAFLTPGQVDALMRQAQNFPNRADAVLRQAQSLPNPGFPVSTPKLTIFNGQTVYALAGTTKNTELTEVGERRKVAMSFREGWALEICPAVSADRKSATLRMRPMVTAMVSGGIEPVFDQISSEYTLAVPDGKTMVLWIPLVRLKAIGVMPVPNTGGATRYEVVTSTVKQPAGAEHVLLLVGPRIIVQQENGRPTTAPTTQAGTQPAKLDGPGVSATGPVMTAAEVAEYHRKLTGEDLSYEALKKHYTDQAVQAAQSGGDPNELETALRRAMAFRQDEATLLQLYVYLGDAYWRQTEKYTPEVWRPQRKKAAEAYFTGLAIVLRQALPAEPPELPGVGKYDVSGSPEVEEQFRQRHARQVAARKEAERLRELVQFRQVFTGQIIQIYAREPDDFEQLRQLALEHLGSQEIAAKLVAGARAYRADPHTRPVIVTTQPASSTNLRPATRPATQRPTRP